MKHRCARLATANTEVHVKLSRMCVHVDVLHFTLANIVRLMLFVHQIHADKMQVVLLLMMQISNAFAPQGMLVTFASLSTNAK